MLRGQPKWRHMRYSEFESHSLQRDVPAFQPTSKHLSAYECTRLAMGPAALGGWRSRLPRYPIHATGCHVDNGAASSSDHMQILTKLLPVGFPV